METNLTNIKKTKIKQVVPYGIQYLSEWEDYILPEGHCIVDKGVTGCGYTEYCLTNDLPTVLCSPRKLLLENKFEQHNHDGDINILYLVNNTTDSNNGYDLEKDWANQIFNHLDRCNDAKKIPKFLVTYDSLYHLIECFKRLGISLGEYYFIVDEFQSIFLDAFFKSSVEFDFVDYLQECPNVLYLSATPMLDKYLLKVNEFKDLDFYELDWSKSGCTENVKIFSKRMYSISGECRKIINDYKEGKFPTSLDSNKNIIESKEAVFYLNSVSDIIRIVKSAKLSPSEVNIICSNIPENQKKLKDLSKDLGYDSKKGNDKFLVGKVPLKGETNKMFTFCTRSVYMGADFYSTCASSYVFADPNIKSLALDISLDLPQIVGRQRNRSNPFKNNLTLFYKVNKTIQTREEFEELQNKRRKSTKTLLLEFNKMSSEGKVEYLHKLRSDIDTSKYERDFVSISKKTGEPVWNTFVEISNERSWEVSQRDYQDRITVTKVIESKGYTVSEEGYFPEDPNFTQFKEDFNKVSKFNEKLEVYCKYLDFYRDNTELSNQIKFYVKDPDYQKFYDYYGTDGCKSLHYRKGLLEEGMKLDKKESSKEIDMDLIYSSFVVGEKYSFKQIKQLLTKLYSENNISLTAKAKDLEKYYNLEEVRILNSETGKRDRGFKLISRR